MVDIAITVRNADQSLTQKYPIHPDSPVSFCKDDPTLRTLIQQAKDAFGQGYEDVIVKAKFFWE